MEKVPKLIYAMLAVTRLVYKRINRVSPQIYCFNLLIFITSVLLQLTRVLVG